MNEQKVYKLKQCIESAYSLLGVIEETKIDGIKKENLRYKFSLDVIFMILYFCVSNGNLSEQKVHFINILFDMDATLQNYMDVIKNNNVYSTEFEKADLESLRIIKSYDDIMGRITHKLAIPPIIELLENIAKETVNIDDNVTDRVKDDYNIFFANLKKNFMPKDDNLHTVINSKNTSDVSNSSLKDYYLKKKNLM